MNSKLVRGLVSGAALLMAQSTLAATFDFTGLGSVSSSGYSTSVDGIGVDVTAGGKLAFYKAPFVSGIEGLGHSGCVFWICSSALQRGESLTVEFSEAVTVTGITLAAWDGNETATVTANNGSSLVLGSDMPGQVDTFSLEGLGEITSFTISSGSFTAVYALAGLQVQPIAPVPVPAAAWLFMSAMGGLVGARRMRRSA